MNDEHLLSYMKTRWCLKGVERKCKSLAWLNQLRCQSFKVVSSFILFESNVF